MEVRLYVTMLLKLVWRLRRRVTKRARLPQSSCICRMNLDRLDFGNEVLQWYNPSISWTDAYGAMPCLVANGCECKSSTNCVVSALYVSHHAEVTKRSNGVLCNDKVLVSVKWPKVSKLR